MASKLTNSDLKDIAKLIAKELKSELISEVKSEIKSLIQAETVKLTDEIDTLRLENSELKTEPNKSAFQIDELEQYGRRMCLDLSGIEGDKGDFSENVEAKVLKLFFKNQVT